MTASCICCGGPVEGVSLDHLKVAVTPIMAEVIEILSRRPGHWTRCEDIADFVYRSDPSGGPEHAASVIRVTVCQNRPRMAALGWNITGRACPGGGYMLVQTARSTGAVKRNI